MAVGRPTSPAPTRRVPTTDAAPARASDARRDDDDTAYHDAHADRDADQADALGAHDDAVDGAFDSFAYKNVDLLDTMNQENMRTPEPPPLPPDALDDGSR